MAYVFWFAHSKTGFANTDHGVTIDLSAVSDVEVSNDKTSVSIGVGARWDKVYTTVEQRGLGVAGGRVFTVGTGGSIVGGAWVFVSIITPLLLIIS